MDEEQRETLMSLDGMSYELGNGLIVEFAVKSVDVTPQRPHGLEYALVLRPKGGKPLVRFDNAHAVDEPRRGYRPKRVVFDHWHMTAKDKGSPYNFTTPLKLLGDFWKEVKRVLDEKGIPNDL